MQIILKRNIVLKVQQPSCSTMDVDVKTNNDIDIHACAHTCRYAHQNPGSKCAKT